jgi:hypothetical protein
MTAVNFTFEYSATKNLVFVTLNEGNNSAQAGIVADISITAIGNDFDTNYTDSVLSPLLNVKSSKSFNFSAQLLKPA